MRPLFDVLTWLCSLFGGSVDEHGDWGCERRIFWKVVGANRQSGEVEEVLAKLVGVIASYREFRSILGGESASLVHGGVHSCNRM